MDRRRARPLYTFINEKERIELVIIFGPKNKYSSSTSHHRKVIVIRHDAHRIKYISTTAPQRLKFPVIPGFAGKQGIVASTNNTPRVTDQLTAGDPPLVEKPLDLNFS